MAGPIGTGKTHLAIALGVEATKQKRRVLFTRAADLVRQLLEARDARELTRLQQRLFRVEVVGVAPLARDRGTLRGTRLVWGGRAPVRAVLSMGALVAARRHVVIRAFYLRLIVAGTPKNVALTACMRTLLTILNAMMRTNTAWQQITQPVSALSRERGQPRTSRPPLHASALMATREFVVSYRCGR